VSDPKSTKSLVLRFVVHVKLSVSIPFHIKDMEKEDLELFIILKKEVSTKEPGGTDCNVRFVKKRSSLDFPFLVRNYGSVQTSSYKTSPGQLRSHLGANQEIWSEAQNKKPPLFLFSECIQVKKKGLMDIFLMR